MNDKCLFRKPVLNENMQMNEKGTGGDRVSVIPPDIHCPRVHTNRDGTLVQAFQQRFVLRASLL